MTPASIHGWSRTPAFPQIVCIYSCAFQHLRNYCRGARFLRSGTRLRKIPPILWPKITPTRWMQRTRPPGKRLLRCICLRECCRPVESGISGFEKARLQSCSFKAANSPSLQVFLLFVQPHCCWAVGCPAGAGAFHASGQLWPPDVGNGERAAVEYRAGAGADPQWLCLDGNRSGLGPLRRQQLCRPRQEFDAGPAGERRALLVGD